MDNNNNINNNTRPPSPKKQRNIVNPRKSKRRSPIARGRIIKLTPIDRPFRGEKESMRYIENSKKVTISTTNKMIFFFSILFVHPSLILY